MNTVCSWPLALVLLLCLRLVPDCAAYFFRFDGPEEFVQYFQEAGLTAGAQYGYSTEPGAGKTPGHLTRIALGAEALVLRWPLAWDGSSALWAGTYFYYARELVSTRPGRTITLGLQDSDTCAFYGYQGVAWLSVALLPAAGGESGSLVLENKKATDEFGLRSSSPAFPLATGWYSLAGRWTLGEQGAIDFASALLWHGPNGADAGIEVRSVAQSLENPAIASDGRLYLGFRWTDAVWHVDNIWVVPEPPDLPLGGAVILLCRMRPWRRRGSYLGIRPADSSAADRSGRRRL